MDNFKIIYKILKLLECSMDADEYDKTIITAERLNITQNRFDSILAMLQESGYIDGVLLFNVLGGRGVKIDTIRITLRGLEYLEENSFMKKASNIAKGISELIP